MADFVKKEQLNGSQKVVVGDRYNDLVLRTLGRVYIQTGSKFTLLTEYLDKVTNEKAGNKILVWNDESELTDIRYPGDGYFIFISSTKDLYITFAGGYVPLIIAGTSSLDWEALNKRFLSTSGGDVDNYVRVNGELIAEKGKFSDQVEITSRKPPLKVISKELVKNFNSEYIGGYNESEVGIKVRDEGITGQWKFNNVTTFNDMVRYSGKLVDSSGFVPGFTGYGWMLDTETCTLTVDNLIVRRIMNVYELVVNKISATNGSLWVSDSAKVKSTDIIEPGHELYSLRESSEFESNHSYPQYNSVTDSNDMINIYDAYFPGDFYHIILEEDYNPFRMNDLLRCQRFTGTSIKYYDAIVTNVISSNELMIRLSNSLNDTYNVVEGDVVTNKPQNQYEVNENGETIEISSTTFDKSLTEPAEGDGLVRIGSSARRDRQGAIYITSNDVNSPYIDILDGVHLPNFNKIIKYKDNNGKLVNHKCLKIRLGNLSGIYDPDFVTQPQGYGLYADNVFIKGRFMQVNNSGTSTPIPVYRGEWNATTDYYKDDQVTHVGQLYGATKDNKNNSPELLNAWQIVISKGDDGETGNGIDSIIGYYLLTDTKTGITHDTPGWTTTPGNLDEVNKYLWKHEIINYTDGTFAKTNPLLIGTHGEDGLPGDKGDQGAIGPSLTFFGKYDPLETAYPLKLDNRVVVYVLSHSGENKEYFQTKLLSTPVNVPPGSNLPDPAYWEPFGGNFQSIATGTLFAEGANIANFIFRNQIMESRDRTVINGKETPNLKIDGKTGKIEAQDGLFRGEVEATSGKFSGGITVGNNAGIYGNENVTPPGSTVSSRYAPVFYSGKKEDGGLFTAADAANMLSSYFNPNDDNNRTHKSFVIGKEGKMFCNDAIIKEGEIGNLKIRDGEIIGYNSLNKPSLRITKNNIETLDQLTQPKFQFVINDRKSFYNNEFSYGDYFANVSKPVQVSGYAFDVSARTKIKINYSLSVTITENNLPQSDDIVYKLKTINLVSVSSGTTIKSVTISNSSGTLEFDVPSPGQYIVDYRGTIDLSYMQSSGNSGSVVFDYTVGSNIYEYVYETATIIGSDGIVSYWGPNDYFYIKKRSDGMLDVKIKGNVEIINQQRDITKNLTVQDLPNIKILSHEEIKLNDHPEGTIYKDENGFLKVI